MIKSDVICASSDKKFFVKYQIKLEVLDLAKANVSTYEDKLASLKGKQRLALKFDQPNLSWFEKIEECLPIGGDFVYNKTSNEIISV